MKIPTCGKSCGTGGLGKPLRWLLLASEAEVVVLESSSGLSTTQTTVQTSVSCTVSKSACTNKKNVHAACSHARARMRTPLVHKQQTHKIYVRVARPLIP